MSALLEARGLAAGYHGHPVVNDLDLTVAAGEVVALLGPNGAGKTTTLMTLAGHLRPIGGEVLRKGEPTTAPLFRRARGGLALVTEERSVFMRLTTADNLRVGGGDVAQALELFPELQPLMKRLAGQLSGGEQQMLTLARALSRNPDLVIADELSLGLAPLIVTRLWQALRKAADERGVGVLIVEQHIHQAMRYADRIYVLRRGAVVLSGTVDEVSPKIDQAYLAEAE
jgi:branched-chain amino acid transport system ATP-binding protein